MSTPSLFGRLTRYAYNARRQPFEERLTEAFAATLRASPAATATLFDALGLDAGPASAQADVDVVTQRYTTAGDRVDVEVSFGSVARPSGVVWLELKWDARPDAEQLRKYAAALRAMPWPTALCFIAPDVHRFDEDVPGIHTTWQDVAVALRTWLEEDGAERPDDHGTVMVDEFIEYLEENDLAMTDAFTLTDALALSHYAGARDRIRLVIQRTHGELERSLQPAEAAPGDGDSWQRPSNPQEFWRTYATPPALAGAGRKHWLEFHGRYDGNRARPLGDMVFGAGLSSAEQDAYGESHAAWLSEMQGRGFEYEGDGEHMYLFRYRYPAELVGGADLHEQGTMLAAWVLETFALLEAHPPPQAA